jgi:outer membrane protein TolC
MRHKRQFTAVLAASLAAAGVVGCRSVREHRREADEAANGIIKDKQQQLFGRQEPFTIEQPQDTLRRRLMLDQNLQYSNPASLSVKDLKPIKHWPADDYLDPSKGPAATRPAGYDGGVLRLSLEQALHAAAYNSPDYQNRKEQVFISALGLETRRDEFRTQWAGILNAGLVSDHGPDDPVTGVVASPELSADQKFSNGLQASVRLAFDLAKLLTQSHQYSLGMLMDASVSLPLLRGSGQYIVMEPLTQAERDVAYALLDFDQYKRQFAVSIASSYLGVLQQYDRLENQADNYRRVIISTSRSRALAKAGRQTEVEYGQAFQQELSARESWVLAQQSVQRSLDNLKALLGLPPDANVELDRDELRRLEQSLIQKLHVTPVSGFSDQTATQPTTRTEGVGIPTTQPAATQPSMRDIVLVPPTGEEAGPLYLPEQEAIRLALEHRPDLRATQGEVYDAQRKVVVAADALRAGLDVGASASFGEGRGSVGSARLDDAQLRPEKGLYKADARLDLPLERTAQQNNYRISLISLERAARAVQQAEDDIKSAIRNELRTLLQAGESLKTQSQAVALAQRRVDSTDKLLQAGRVAMRDVLDAQSSLVSAQNQLTSALVNYRVAELELQRDLGLLEVNQEGLWREYSPEGRQK